MSAYAYEPVWQDNFYVFLLLAVPPTSLDAQRPLWGAFSPSIFLGQIRQPSSLLPLMYLPRRMARPSALLCFDFSSPDTSLWHLLVNF